MKHFFFLLLVSVFVACHPFDAPEQQEILTNSENKTMEQLVVPDAFTFNTHKKVNVNVSIKDNNGDLLKNVPFNLYVKSANSTDSSFLMTAQTNTEGVFQTALELSTDVETLIATTNYIGVPSYQTTKVSSSNVYVVFGEDNNINTPHQFVEKPVQVLQSPNSPNAASFSYIGTYDGYGVPRYLLPKGDVVSESILETINASLPEGDPLTKSHPEYLSNTKKQNLSLKEKAEVWITFVHEGAGYTNALGYYTYPTKTPPTSTANIEHKLIFPNASFKGSSGGLKTGDKVSLGVFEAGTTIAWFVVPNGWNSRTQKVAENYGYPIHYSNNNLNSFTSSDYRQHVVTLVDAKHQLFLVGFEDLNRPEGDNDFNDAVFYATISSFAAVETTELPKTQTVDPDTDVDGVPDKDDKEPNNPDVAYHQYTPSINQSNTLAFEDFWPKQGDYDMNDLVVDYNIQEKLNAANKIKSIKYKLTLRALGASFRNGFAFELPIAPDKIASVEGAKIKDSYIKLNANGTEANQTKAVIVAFDNSYSLMSGPTTGFVNTEKDKTMVAPYTFEVTVTLKTPVTRAELGSAPYNPFIIINKERGKEVHLPGYTPTALADKTLFKTGDDDSNGSNKFYQTKRNLPWAIHISTTFQYPIEKTPINQAFLKFNNWAESAGTSYPDWFNNKTDYRNVIKLY